MDSSGRREAILDRLRANGGRITSARRAIIDALIEHEGHPTAEELMLLVQAQHPDVAGSTVYRFLDDLEQLGVVDHVHLGHGPAVYHFADDPHHHLVCTECGHVAEVPHAVFAALTRRLHNDYGFELEPRHFAVSGRCTGCTPS